MNSYDDEIVTEQQAAASKIFEKMNNDYNYNFWDWYSHYCYENNLSNDSETNNIEAN